MKYEPEFLWGAAISADQVEGVSAGGENGDWYQFEHTDHHIQNGDTADAATDHWNRYSEDFELAAGLTLNTLRTSIAWEKVEPAAGVFSAEAIAHYRAEFQRLRELGLRPMITLLHGTTPLWFQSAGGWLADDSPRQFLKYSEFVVQQLGDLCDLWATINEPMVLIGEGYLDGHIPPQVASPAKAVRAGRNLVRGHRMATAKIHDLQPPSAPASGVSGVGLVNSLDIYDPLDSSNPLDVAVTDLVSDISNWALLKAAVHGQFDLKELASRLRIPELQDADSFVDELPGNARVDWIGVNYYTRNMVQFNWKGRPNLTAPAGPKGDNGWTVYPEGLERVLRSTADRFPGISIIITENGMADAKDQLRPQLIRDTLTSLDRAKAGHDGKAPIDVRGYYHWSLTDFEWEFGYAHRFGVIEILHDQHLKRVARPSADVYRQEIAARRPV